MLFAANIIRLGGLVTKKITINAGVNVDLTSVSAFTDLGKLNPIEVTLTGTFYATNTGDYAFDCGNLSTWTEGVAIIAASGCKFYGKGGAGNSGAGGHAFNCNSANNSGILSVWLQSGSIAAGGGGGGKKGSNSNHSHYIKIGSGKTSTCNGSSSSNGGGGGGGGGRTWINVSGGAGGSSSGCSTPVNGASGGTGTSSSAGGGGTRGTGRYNVSSGSTCPACQYHYGGNGSSGGSWATAGGGSGGGSAGQSVANQGSAAYTNNGTVY